MAINITDIRMANEFNSGTTRYLNGNLLEKITVEIDFDIINAIQVGLTGDPNNIEFRPSGIYAFQNVMQIINSAPLFADFFIGDVIKVLGGLNGTGGGQNYTIINKFNNYTIEVAETLVHDLDDDTIIICQTVYKAFDFYFGLIENTEAVNFLSKVDGNIQKYNVSDASVVGSHNLTALGQKSWQIGSCEIENIDGISYTITQELYINPLWLSSWVPGTYPAIFDNNKCLKHCFKIVARPTQNDPNRSLEKTYTENGNTGWIDENVNTGITNYSISNVTYEDGTTSVICTGVLLTDSTTTVINFDIDNAIDSPFTSSTKFKVHFVVPPFDTVDYQNNGLTLDVNFTFDSALQQVGAALVDGEFARCVKNVIAILTSSSKISVSMEIDLSTPDYARIMAWDNQKFLIAATVADVSLGADETDSVTLLVGYEDFEIPLGTDDVVTASFWRLSEHPKHAAGLTNDAADYEFYSEDEILSYVRLKIDGTDSLYTPSIRKIECGVRAYNTSNSELFILDSISQNTSGYTIINGIQQINYEAPRGHRCLPTELFKKFKIERMNGMDANPIWYFDVYFPFLCGWEYWELNNLVNTDFFDTAEANDGFNNEWQNKDSVTNWELQAYVDVTVRFGTVDLVYRLTKIIMVNDYNQNSDWTNEDIKAFDSASNDLGDNILGYDYTTIKAEMEYAGMLTPTVDDVEWCIRLEPKENGGRNVSTRFSSVIAMTTDTQWLSTDTNNKIIKSVVGNVFYAELKIDNTLLQQFPNFDITARLFEVGSFSGACNVNGFVFENGDCMLMEDGTDFVQENP